MFVLVKTEKQHAKMFLGTMYSVKLKYGSSRQQGLDLETLSKVPCLKPRLLLCPFSNSVLYH